MFMILVLIMMLLRSTIFQTLDASVSNNKQRWNDDKCRYECKKLIDKGLFDKGYIWEPSDCEYECDKSCDVGEYLD